MVDAQRTLEQGGTDEISIWAGTMYMVEGIVWHVREEILSGCVGGIMSAATTAAAGGDNGMAERLWDKDYCHHLQSIADNVLAMTIDWYLSSSNLSCY